MTFDELQRLLSAIAYPGVKFHPGIYHNPTMIAIYMQVVDTSGQSVQLSRGMVFDDTLDPPEMMNRIVHALMEMVLHEAQEQLTIRGEHLFNPHRGPHGTSGWYHIGRIGRGQGPCIEAARLAMGTVDGSATDGRNEIERQGEMLTRIFWDAPQWKP